MILPQPPLLVITDRHQARKPLEIVIRDVLEAGCRWISLREKDLAPEKQLELLRRLMSLGRAYDATIGVHSDISAAQSAGAVHVHLPSGSNLSQARRLLGTKVLIGVSTHNRVEAEAAQRAGADYCTLSPIFRTQSKPNYTPTLGVTGLAQVSKVVSIPLLALGGITTDTGRNCLTAGARGIAVMGTIMRAEDPLQQTRCYLTAIPTMATES